MKLRLTLALAVTAVALSADPITCSTPCAAYSFSTAPTTSDNNPLSFGFQFTTNEQLTISALGYYDYAGDGFSAQHEVGIYDSAGALLISATLEAGTSDPLIGDFRYTPIPLLTLAANQPYTIAATTGGPSDMWAYGVAGDSIAGFLAHPTIQIGQGAAVFAYTSDHILQYPTEHWGYTMYSGPNFLIQQDSETVTPEPATVVLLGSALGALFFVRRRPR